MFACVCVVHAYIYACVWGLACVLNDEFINSIKTSICLIL
jgi:hypothetical protein